MLCCRATPWACTHFWGAKVREDVSATPQCLPTFELISQEWPDLIIQKRGPIHISPVSRFVNGQCFRNPKPYNLSKQKVRQYTSNFVRQYAPHLYRRTFLSSKLRRKGNPAIRLPFVPAIRLPFCTAVRPPLVRQYFWKNTGGWGHRKVSE